ncbi:MAG: MFS transporter [Candidatus Daviesbacteria bacterium]|nr:MFS transporter [Candidatus Daviesbacteria bacterium]
MKKIKTTLIIIQVLNLLASNLLGPIYATYVKGLGGDLLTAGGAIALNFVVIGLLIIISGRVADKYHTEKIQLILGYSLAVLAAFGFMIINSPIQLFIVEAIAGVSIALSIPAFSGLFSSVVETGKHASSWGDYLGMTYFAAAISAFGSGFIAQNFGFSALFITMIIINGLSVVGAIYLYFADSKHQT